MLETLFGSTRDVNLGDTARLARIEQKLDLILSHLGLNAPPSSSANQLAEVVQSLLARGKKIEAIKVYREETGAGLRDAKNAVEALERQGR